MKKTVKATITVEFPVASTTDMSAYAKAIQNLCKAVNAAGGAHNVTHTVEAQQAVDPRNEIVRTPEAFFAAVKRHGIKHFRGTSEFCLRVWACGDDAKNWRSGYIFNNQGGFGAEVGGSICYGDTIGEAIQAAWDALVGAPSKHPKGGRLNPPYFNSDRNKPEKAARYEYDYRSEDWTP